VVNLESWDAHGQQPRRALRLEAVVNDGKIRNWTVAALKADAPLQSSDKSNVQGAKVALQRNFEFRVPLEWLDAVPHSATPGAPTGASRLRLRLSLWHNRLPVDALPLEGWIELHVLEEAELQVLF
jgi:hypothetical protein